MIERAGDSPPDELVRPDIAGELSLSPSTVSTHIRNIDAKLRVRDLSSAIHRARELRLLSVGRIRSRYSVSRL